MEPQMTSSSRSRMRRYRELFENYFENPLDFIDRNSIYLRGTSLEAEVTPLHDVLGLKYLGNGAHATVYALSSFKVLKVVTDKNHGDPAYDRYVDLAMENWRNPYFPEIFYRGEWAGRKVYVLERLDSLESNDFERAVALFNNRYDAPSSRYVQCACPWLQQAMDAIKEKFGGMNDAGGRNLMQRRRDQHPVFSDPVA